MTKEELDEDNRRQRSPCLGGDAVGDGQADVFGAVRRSPRLHWSFDDAPLEAEGWAGEMQAGPIAWARIEDGIAVGRTKGHAVVLRSILLPLGPPPA